MGTSLSQGRAALQFKQEHVFSVLIMGENIGVRLHRQLAQHGSIAIEGVIPY